MSIEGEQSTSPESAALDERAVASSFVEFVREITGNKGERRLRYEHKGKPSLLSPAVIEVEQWSDQSDIFIVRVGSGDRDDPEISVAYNYDKQFTDDIEVAKAEGRTLEPDAITIGVGLEDDISVLGADERQKALETVSNTVSDLRAQLAETYELAQPSMA